MLLFFKLSRLAYTLIQWEAIRAARGGGTPVKILDPGFIDPPEASVFLSPTALLGESQPRKMTVNSGSEGVILGVST